MNAGEVADPLGAAPRLAALRAAIATRARDCDRDPAAVTLVAVSKTYAADQVWPTIALGGQTIFGENRVQEAKGKWPELRARAAELGKTIELHLIGPLQSNKAAEAAELFDVIETVDRVKLAEALKAAMDKQKKNLPCFIQVNTGDEEQKGGVAPRDLEALYKSCVDLGLNIQGLMCIPPAADIPDLHFALLHKLAGNLGLKSLSMGMSSDFETAIRFGATHVRIGSALFGERI